MFDFKLSRILNIDNENGILIKGSAIFMIFQLLGILFGFVNVWVITRYFGAEAQGIIALLFSYVAIILAFTQFGTTVSILRIISELQVKEKFSELREFYLKVNKLVALLSIFVSVVLFIGADFIAAKILNKIQFANYIRIASVAILPISLLEINSELIRSYKKMVQYGFLQYCVSMFSIIILLMLVNITALSDESIPLIVQVLSNILMFIISVYFVKRLIKSGNQELSNAWSSRKIISFSFPFFGAKALTILSTWADIIILGFFCSASDIGIYFVMKKIASLAGVVFMAVNAPVIPQYAQLFSKNDMTGLKKLIRRSAKLISVFTLLSFLIIIIFRKPFVGLFGAGFEKGIDVLILLASIRLFVAWTGPLAPFLMMTGKEKFNQTVIFFSVLLFILLCILLIPVYGILGAAIARVMVVVTRKTILTIYIKKHYGLSFIYIPEFFRRNEG